MLVVVGWVPGAGLLVGGGCEILLFLLLWFLWVFALLILWWHGYEFVGVVFKWFGVCCVLVGGRLWFCA